jgi:hypothetical protein
MALSYVDFVPAPKFVGQVPAATVVLWSWMTFEEKPTEHYLYDSHLDDWSGEK